MADARWGDTILDFNLFFLGFKSDNLKVDGEYDRAVFDFPNAVSAAQAMLSGGDYFRLFDFEGPFFMAPLRTEALEDAPLHDDAGLTPEQMRKKAVGELKDALLQLLEKPRTRLRTRLKPRLQRHPKRPESLDLGKQVGYFARGEHDGGRDFAADQAVDRAGFYFAELDFGGSRRHQRCADASLSLIHI